MNPDTLEINVAGTKLTVPLYGDPVTTRRIVKLVNERIKAIEKKSKRIDTQAFALLTAISFAAENAEAARQQSHETAELVASLGDLASSLKSLLDDFPSKT